MTSILENNIVTSDYFKGEQELAKLFDNLNAKPDTSHIRQDNYSKTQYIPISHLEMLLDKHFGPLNWKTDNFQLLPLGANPKKPEQVYVAATITLSVLNENFGPPVWVSREGAASGYCSHGVIATFAAKLKADAFKNAVKSIGKVFGRDLNRKHVEDISSEVYGSVYVEELEGCTTRKELIKVWKSIPVGVQKEYTELFQEISNKIKK